MSTSVWQTDFYRRPLQDEGQPVWELVICCAEQEFIAHSFCQQSAATAAWLTAQLRAVMQQHGRPQRLEVFRPQCLSLITTAAQSLSLSVVATRRTPLLKAHLKDRVGLYAAMAEYTREPYQPTWVESPPPLPVPEALWGEQWRFGAIAAAALTTVVEEPIPIRDMPPELSPLALKLASDTLIPGVIIDGGRQAMRLAQWLEAQSPVSLGYSPGPPDGLILEAGLSDRWILATFEDEAVAQAGQTFQKRQQTSQGLHFLLVQPDDSGVTYSGIWLLRPE